MGMLMKSKTQDTQETRLFTGWNLGIAINNAALRGGYQEASGPPSARACASAGSNSNYSYLISLHLQDENRVGSA